MPRPRSRPRKLLLLKLGVFLLMGAIVNVAVAWGCAWSAPSQLTGDWGMMSPYMKDEEVRSLCARSGYEIEGEVLGDEWRWSGSRSVSIVPQEALFERNTLRHTETGELVQQIELGQFGWPVLGLHYEIRMTSMPLCRYGVQLAVERWREGTNVQALPLLPLWPGFAINTIFYAAILWLLWIAPGKIRRFIRVRARRCPACGYKIAEGVGPNCSECGHPLSLRRSAGM